MTLTPRDTCWHCGAECPATNEAGTQFTCPGCGESWAIVPASEEEIGDDSSTDD